jgi:hypothetical protein
MSFIEEQKIDGVKYSKWRPEYNKNTKVLEENNIKTNSQYRKFMTENADSIIRMNGVIDRQFCSSVDNYNNVPMSKTPYIYSTSEMHAYNESDLKNEYIDKFTEKANMRASTF